VILADVDPGTRAVLERFGFDERRFAELQERVASGALSRESNVVRGTVTPVAAGDVSELPQPGTRGHDEAYEIGIEAVREGRVAHLVLAGGMATRFGGVVKAVVPALDGSSFLEITLGETARLGRELGVSVPVVLMTSFATDEVVRAHVAERGLGAPLVFNQFVAPRLEPDGTLFRGGDGKVSLYGPGHGDLVEALRTSGALDRLERSGVRQLVVANVDNLAARIDPAVVGMHLLAGRSLTLEVARAEGDVGGVPARVDGAPTMLEGPRVPAGFDAAAVGLVNTNTGIIDLDVLRAEHELGWLYVERQAEGRSAVQLERLYHELSVHVPANFLTVPRGGRSGRFLPVKTPDDLARVEADLRAVLALSTVAAG
jgi:UTP--glucose-1-phosphate uridylyltransferase